jgi:hypothetical protein
MPDNQYNYWSQAVEVARQFDDIKSNWHHVSA